MKGFVLTAIMLLAAATLVHAQFSSEAKYDSSAVSAVVERVHNDLNHSYGVWHFSSGDRDRLNHAEKELREFAQKWEHGKFDKGQIGDAVESVQHVLDNNKLPSQDRDAISDDMTQLRRMREAYEHHEIEGAHH